MTREEIIEQLNLAIGLIKQDGKDWLDERDIPMLEECVKALSQEPCEVEATKLQQSYNKGFEDCRQAAIEAVSEGCQEWRGIYGRCEELINALPSVTQKSGKWIEQEGWDGDVYYECSMCGESFCLIDGTPTDNMYNYCPNCGCRMVEPQERSDKE